MTFLALALACHCSSAPDDGDTTSTDPGTTPDTDTNDTATGTGTDDSGTTPTDTDRCPSGMVLVADADVAYCIDAYEVNKDSGVAVSAEGQTPSTGMSYDEAVAICAATPVVDGTGATVGWKRLATSTEWEDAADGRVGDGGHFYPYGDEFDATACATPLADGTVVLESETFTGSYPRCRSDFGTFDQSGNVWEWADSEMHVDSAAWLAARAAEGVTVSLDPDGVRVSGGDTSLWYANVVGVNDGHVQVADDGRLWVDPAGVNDMENRPPGYLLPEINATGEEDFLLVTISEDAEAGRDWVVPWDEDGAPIPDKRGGAWYVGDDYTARTDARNLVHYHTFGGSIGFRCTCDPLR